MTTVFTPLEELVARELDRPVPAGAHALVERLRVRFGHALRGVLMYGSNLRQGDDREGVLDLYALVSSYPNAYPQQPVLAGLNRILPPNVLWDPLESTCRHASLSIL